MQRTFRLPCVGHPVDSLLDVLAAACGLILDPALRHAVGQGGTCNSVSHCGHRPVVNGSPGVLLWTPALSGAMPPFPYKAEGLYTARQPAGLRRCAVCGGCWDQLQVELRVLLGRAAVAVLETQPSDEVVTSASAGDRGPVLRAAVGTPIVVSLCLTVGMR